MAKNPHAVALGKLGGLKGGKARTAAKIAAARANGAKGGRPKGPKRKKPSMSDQVESTELDNPPAFPQPLAVTHEGRVYQACEAGQFAGGMDLRDYFAAKWLHSTARYWAQIDPTIIARQAYDIADAMLAERSKRG